MGTLTKVLLGTVAVGAIAFWAFSGSSYKSTTEALAYDSVEECIKAKEYSAQECRAEYDKAKKLHAEAAPRYSNSNSCYSDFGYNRCYQSGSSVWIPFMMGYMLAPRGASTYVATQPLYRTAGSPNRFHTAGGSQVDAVKSGGRTRVASTQTSQPKARTRTVARGGFGARAAGRSSGA